MKTLTKLSVIIFLFSGNLYPQHDQLQQNHHKYLTEQAWNVVKEQYQFTQYTAMNSSIGSWTNGNLNSTGPWLGGTVMTGAFREDAEDVVYGHTGPFTTITHFWDVESCGPPGDNCLLWYLGYGYANSYMKTQAYWYGNVGGSGFVEVPSTNSWYTCGLVVWKLRLKYNNLADVYKYDQIWATHFLQLGSKSWIAFQQPILFKDLMMGCGYSYNQVRSKIAKICWEVVGRICHLLEDSGVPAHTHNDLHVTSDYYEDVWMPSHFQDKNYTHAISEGGLININDKQYPLRYAMYTTNQVADRFPSDDGWADCCYSGQYGNDNYGTILTPIYNSINSIVPFIQYQAFGNNPPENLMTHITNYSYVYSMRSVAGFLWYVYNQFGIQSNPPPVISGFTQSPPIICIGSYGTVTCILSQGNNNVTYNWRYESKPGNVSVTFSGNHATIYYGVDDISPVSNNVGGFNNSMVPVFTLYCEAINSSGSSGEQHYVPILSTNCGGCPWAYVLNTDSIYEADNNILHRSEFPENINKDIKDLYKLRVSPYLNNNQILINIMESENDHSYLDQVKLYAIDHPEGTKIDITEDNQIILYDSAQVLSTDYATLNNIEDITDRIQYHIPSSRGLVTGDTLDHIYAHFPNQQLENLAIISELERDVIGTPTIKYITGNLIAQTNMGIYERNFARREEKSVVVIPIGIGGVLPPSLENVSIDYYRDFKVKYIALANISTSGFELTELPLIEASNSLAGDVTVYLLNLDQVYGEVDSSAYLSLTFANNLEPIGPGSIRDYVLETSGRYIRTNSYNIPITNKKNTNPITYKLYINYPNPFNPKTTIRYDISKYSLVKITVYDVLGKVIIELLNEYKNAGSYNITFDGENLSSGVYFYRLDVGDFSDTKKMILIK